jgi:SPP1 gp7 family putative phage head morphogenesis protein
MASIKQQNGRKYLVGKPLQFPAYRGRDYSRAIMSLVSRMTAESRIAYEQLLNSQLGGAATLVRMTAINSHLLSKYNELFAQQLPIMAQSMIFGVNKSSKSALASGFISKEDFAEDQKQARIASISLSNKFLTDEKMYPLFAAQVQQNVALFKTIPPVYFQRVEKAVLDSIVTGRGFADLKPFFQQHSNGTKNYAHLRALDQTRKAYGDINITRIKEAGGTELEWIHSGGGSHPDPRHVKLDGKIFPVDEPPVDYITRGQEVHSWCRRVNCRCTVAPVIRVA